MKRILGLLMAVMMLCGVTVFAATPNTEKVNGNAAAKLTAKKNAVHKPKKHRRHRKSRKSHKMMKTTTTKTETKTQSNQ